MEDGSGVFEKGGEDRECISWGDRMEAGMHFRFAESSEVVGEATVGRRWIGWREACGVEKGGERWRVMKGENFAEEMKRGMGIVGGVDM